MRIDLEKSSGLKRSEIQTEVEKMENFEGAREVIDWIRKI